MELDAILNKMIESGQEVSARDFMAAYPDLPAPTVYSRIRAMVRAGHLVPVGKGRYTLKSKMSYRVEVTPRMKDINSFLIAECSGINHCISDDGVNVCVQVPRGDFEMVLTKLTDKYDRVITETASRRMPIKIVGYIIVSNLVSDAPVCTEQGVDVPTPEKELVDLICSNRKSIESLRIPIQKMMDVYALNGDRLKRYAARRGVSGELADCISAVDMNRVQMFTKVQKYLAGTHITKAWVFGSFARCEEGLASDLDLLVEYDHDSPLSLLGFNRYRLDIEDIVKRDVDLVVNGTLLPYALASSERDKYLLYEK